jgi:D-alanyl-D-alanine carboxypeptidase/D-alanyl-D-alanine-endopeptidase (penicillin-binding protein 4)
MKIPLLLSLCLSASIAAAQSLPQKLHTAFNKLQQDSQCRYASVSLTVLDAKTGAQLFAANPDMGLATASTLKTITSITAFNVLGKDYQFKTLLQYTGSIDASGTLNGDMIIKGGADPTLGSWRYAATKENLVLTEFVDAIQKAGIRRINGRVIGDDSMFDTQSIPDGWIWQDLGTYYGAGPSALCWRENQFDIKLRTGVPGSQVEVVKEVPDMPYLNFKSEMITGEAGTGDQAYPYMPLTTKTMYLRGTYATDQSKKNISAAVPDAAFDAAFRLADTLKRLGFEVVQGPASSRSLTESAIALPGDNRKTILTYQSPKLSQIIYWLNQKSINLYAEQLLKTIALQTGAKVSTTNGVKAIQNFWKAHGLDPHSINIFDGSGLSPADRVTTSTLAHILQSAYKETWFPDFYESLPVYNNMKMKSGSISGVLAYAGFQKTKTGQEVCFSIIVNNYNGKTAGIKQKLFTVLDELKE